MRARVKASAERLGYRPHAAARGMRGQTYTLGVLFSDLHNPFFAEIYAGLEDVLADTLYHPFLAIGRANSGAENAMIDAMVDRQIDGVILVAPVMAPSDIRVLAQDIPTVLMGVHVPDADSFDTVNNDDDLGGCLVVRHLHERGRKRIAYLTLADLPYPEGVTVTHRETGYRRTMQQLGLQDAIWVESASMTTENIRDVATRMLKSPQRPDAIFCWTDYVAFQVIGLAAELGLSVPRDVAVVGYDNTPYCNLPQNSLTSVDQSGRLLGQQATKLLLGRLGGRTASQHYMVTPTLMPRGSSEASGEGS
jgi:DNA-binding LacI/PurR family transcriptional regulator